MRWYQASKLMNTEPEFHRFKPLGRIVKFIKANNASSKTRGAVSKQAADNPAREGPRERDVTYQAQPVDDADARFDVAHVRVRQCNWVRQCTSHSLRQHYNKREPGHLSTHLRHVDNVF